MRSWPRFVVAVVSAILVLLGSVDAGAQVPRLVNYQGYLVDASNQPVNATVTMTFKLYNVTSGGSPLYTEAQSVTVANGVFNAAIGAVTPLTLPFDIPYYLGVAVSPDAEMTPRQAVTAAPYALRAAGADSTAGALFVTAIDGAGNTVKRTWFGNDGNAYTTGTFVNGSDRATKERFAPVTARAVLERVAGLPVTEWSYKGQAQRHIGPMAQDFRLAFGLGHDDKTISTIDAAGVALAAIQGLHQLMREKDREIARLKAKANKVDRLERRLLALQAKLGVR